MAKKLTKAAKIMALYKQKWTTGAIAKAVGCGTSYVRVVTRQRHGTARSTHDLAYVATLKANPKIWAAHVAKKRKYMQAYRKKNLHAIRKRERIYARQRYWEARA